jgi:hypothetical protein
MSRSVLVRPFADADRNVGAVQLLSPGSNRVSRRPAPPSAGVSLGVFGHCPIGVQSGVFSQARACSLRVSGQRAPPVRLDSDQALLATARSFLPASRISSITAATSMLGTPRLHAIVYLFYRAVSDLGSSESGQYRPDRRAAGRWCGWLGFRGGEHHGRPSYSPYLITAPRAWRPTCERAVRSAILGSAEHRRPATSSAKAISSGRRADVEAAIPSTSIPA